MTLEIADSKPTTAEAKSASEDSKLSWSSLHWAVLAWARWYLTKSESVCGNCITYHCRNLFFWTNIQIKIASCFLCAPCLIFFGGYLNSSLVHISFRKPLFTPETREKTHCPVWGFPTSFSELNVSPFVFLSSISANVSCMACTETTVERPEHLDKPECIQVV